MLYEKLERGKDVVFMRKSTGVLVGQVLCKCLTHTRVKLTVCVLQDSHKYSRTTNTCVLTRSRRLMDPEAQHPNSGTCRIYTTSSLRPSLFPTILLFYFVFSFLFRALFLCLRSLRLDHGYLNTKPHRIINGT